MNSRFGVKRCGFSVWQPLGIVFFKIKREIFLCGNFQQSIFPQCLLHPDDTTGEVPSSRHNDDATATCTDVMMYAQNKWRSFSTDTPVPDTHCHIPLPVAKEKTSLARGTLLSEAFTHRSAGSFSDTTVVP